jgi:serine/threonine protein kinase
MQLCTLPAYSLDELYDHIGHPQRVLNSRWGPSHLFEYLVEPADLSCLATNKTILLVDFGQAFFIDRQPTLGLGIPTQYAAPEGVFSNRASPASDVWAIGCLLYEWYTGDKLFSGEDLEEIWLDWAVRLGKLPEPYWSQCPDREEYFDDCGERIVKEGCQVVKDYLEHTMKEHWDRWSTCRGALKKMETKSLKQICDSAASSFSHNLPEIRLSIIEDETKRQLIIAPGFPYKMMTDSPSLVSLRALDSLEPDSAKIEKAKKLIFHNSNQKSEVQLPPLIAGLHCLLRQLLTYDPDKRLPALFISQHSWFSTPLLDESCEPAENDQDIKQCEPSIPPSTQEFNDLSKSVSHSKPLVDEDYQPAKASQDIEQFEHPSTAAYTSKLNSPSKLVSDSDVTKMSMPSKWSLALSMENGTWKYVLSSDIKRPDGDNEVN